MQRWIFFDNDGVLVETEPLFMRANADCLAEHGVALDRATFIDISLRQGRSPMRLALERLGWGEERLPELLARRNARFQELLAAAGDTLRPGVRAVIQDLARVYRLAIVTSARRSDFDLIHSFTDIVQHFAFVLAQGDYARSKPHPDPYLTALERAGCRAEEAVVLEDSPRGIAAGRAAGLAVVGVCGPFSEPADFPVGVPVIRRLDELPAVLAGLDAAAG